MNDPKKPGPEELRVAYAESLRRLADHSASAKRAVDFVQIWNGGGAVAILAFIGTVPGALNFGWTQLCLIAFLLGLFATVATVVFAYEESRQDYEQFVSDMSKFEKGEIAAEALYRPEYHGWSKRLRKWRIAVWCGYLALFLAIAGTALGVLSVLSIEPATADLGHH